MINRILLKMLEQLSNHLYQQVTSEVSQNTLSLI